MLAAVLIPIKSFDIAKGRLSDALSEQQRSTLARQMAQVVVTSTPSLQTWVVCDSNAVSQFAISLGAGVIWRPAKGLNNAVAEGVDFLRRQGVDRVVIAHADLPKATDLSWVAERDPITIVPDRHGHGTNVMCVPTTAKDFVFSYGIGSCQLHEAEARRLNLPVQVVPNNELGWDVDTLEDLAIFDQAGWPTGSGTAPEAN